MAPSVSASQVFLFANANAGTTLTFSAGAPSVDDWDLLFVNSDTTVTTPSGFTLLETQVINQGSYIFGRKAVGGETNQVTITTSGNLNTSVIWRRVTGGNTVDISDSATTGVAGTTTPALTTASLASAGQIVLAFCAVHSFTGAVPNTFTWAGSYAGNEVTGGNQGTGGSGVIASVSFKVPAGPGTESPSCSWNNSANDRYILAVSITEAGQNLSPSGVASGEAFGTPTITPGAVDIAPTGIASGEAFGTPTVTPGAVDIAPTGIASGEAFGTPTIQATADIAPTGIASGEAFGTATITATNELLPTGIASGEAFGTAVISAGPVDIAPTGVASGEAFGLPTIAHGSISQFIEPVGIPSAEAVGTPTIWKHVVRRCDCSLHVGG